jgi:hypothetical protein
MCPMPVKKSVWLALLTASIACAQNTDDAGWKPIFDGKTMNGWYTYQNQAGKNADNGVFKIENGAFHILDLPEGTTGVELNGCLLTNDDYSHVRLRLQYKWGAKQFTRAGRGGGGPRKRDAGLLYYYFGADKIWGNNMELQIQEGDAGDMWVNGNISFVTNVADPKAPAPLLWTLTGGTPATVIGNVDPPMPGVTPGTNQARRVLKYPDWEDTSGWNTVEAVLDGQHIQHYVNGHLVLDGKDAKRRDPNNPDRWIPLTTGKVCLEAEGAEVWYRNIQIKPIGKGSR